MKRITKIIIVGVIIAVLLVLYFSGFGAHRVLSKASFKKLPDWQHANHVPALQAFQKSCADILKQDPEKYFGNSSQNGKNAEWQTICQAALHLKHQNKQTARTFFEKWFQPYSVKNIFQKQGMFTGYYLPLIHASFERSDQYNVPVYGMPKDLVKLNLGDFQPGLHGQAVIARLTNHTLQPYPDRGAIVNGAIEGAAPVLVWADNSVDVFFAHIQGSALVELPNKKVYLLSYAGTNGRPYTAIGKVLVDKKQLSKENVSMQAIRDWLMQHEEERDGILAYDASYVFFTLSPLNEPVGTAQVALTPERSLAVDLRYIPLGAPIWLDTVVPKQDAERTPFRQLLIAQDSGGAIRGVVRGDVFWGAGEGAAFTAGHMKSPGQYWLLLPRQVG